MELLKNRFIPFVFLVGLAIVFFWQFFFKGLMPIPADTIVGLYHPYRDLYSSDYPRGIPYKNFLITDPVRQQYPWRNLSFNLIKDGKIPLWNPYSFSGYPLLANFQSAVFYPLNLFFVLLPFSVAWSFLIVIQIILALIFMFLYLLNLKLNKVSSVLGSIVFSFSGFSVAWLEWGTILQTLLWLPLILLSVDKIFTSQSKKTWFLILTLSLISSFFAGHLQIFFYCFVVFFVYLLIRWFEYKKDKNGLILILVSLLLFIVVTSIQWIPTLQFIAESARSVDQNNWQKIGWFIPWQNLVQFLVPDFFGNPATLNYWGIFNYGEFIGYVGVLPLILSIYALFFKKDKNVFIFGSLFFISLIFALPTPFAKLPYILNLPLLSTAQPTRLLSIVDFSLAVLSAFGLNLFMKEKKKILYPISFISFVYLALWFLVLYFSKDKNLTQNLAVAKNNLILPTLVFFISVILISFSSLKHFKKLSGILITALIFLTIFDLFRFAWKFDPFVKRDYLFPNTKVLTFLENQKGPFRIMATSPEIFPPNFSDVYKIQSLDGYDPLYLLRYGELIAAFQRDEPNINPPFGFDRIITPENINSKLINLLNVKYILSLSDISNNDFREVYSEGQTKVYENKKVLPRAFFLEKTVEVSDKEDSIKSLFLEKDDLYKVAVVEGFKSSVWTKGEADIEKYDENDIVIKTKNEGDGFLILTDSFYPSWHVKIDGRQSKIVKSDYNFRGVMVPKGNHTLEFYITLL